MKGKLLVVGSQLVVVEMDEAVIRQGLGVARAEITDITCLAASALSGGEYFIVGDYYVWFDIDDGSTDPEPDGLTGVEVDVTAADDEDAVAAALQAKLDALSEYGAAVTDDKVTVTNATAGAADDIADVDTGFTFEVTQIGADVGDILTTVDIGDGNQVIDVQIAADGSATVLIEKDDEPVQTGDYGDPVKTVISRILSPVTFAAATFDVA